MLHNIGVRQHIIDICVVDNCAIWLSMLHSIGVRQHIMGICVVDNCVI